MSTPTTQAAAVTGIECLIPTLVVGAASGSALVALEHVLVARPVT